MIKLWNKTKEAGGWVLLSVVSFLLGRVIFPGGMIPLGYGWFAASLEQRLPSVVVGILVSAGALSTGFNARSLIVIISMLTLSAYGILRGGTKKTKYRLVPFLLSGIGASVVVILINGFLWYDFFMALAQNLVGCVGYFIFQSAMGAAQKSLHKNSKREKLILNEEITALTITLILSAWGLPELELFGINLRNAFGMYLIILFAFAGSRGVLHKMGKWGVCIAVGVSGIGLTLLLESTPQMVGLLTDLLAADFLFFVTPEKWIKKIRLPGAAHFRTVVEKANYTDEMTGLVVGRLEGFSKSYYMLARSFAKFAKGEESNQPEPPQAMVWMQKACIRVCEGCDMEEYCWNQKKDMVEKSFLQIGNALLQKGNLMRSDVPEFFETECEHPDAIFMEFRVAYEVNRVEQLWKQRLLENKEIYAKQLGAFAAATHHLAEEMQTDLQALAQLSEKVEIALQKAGHPRLKATVLQNRYEKYEVTLTGLGEIEKSLAPILSGVLGRTMKYMGEGQFAEVNRLQVLTGAATAAKQPNAVSGDSYAFLENGNGCFMAVLCDGMGTGKKAREESEMAVRMLEHFYKNGFDNEAAIEMINSALILKSEEDHYSTLDLVSVHLQTGNVELVKYGGMPTVLKYDVTGEADGPKRYVPTIETIRSDTLPVGILGDVSGRTVRKRVYHKDMIIMMTDGVFDGFRHRGKTGGDLVRFIETLDCNTPKQMADSILAESLQWQQEKRPSDDMTVLVLQVLEAS